MAHITNVWLTVHSPAACEHNGLHGGNWLLRETSKGVRGRKAASDRIISNLPIAFQFGMARGMSR